MYTDFTVDGFARVESAERMLSGANSFKASKSRLAKLFSCPFNLRNLFKSVFYLRVDSCALFR